mmetsp:Transcript_39150/g.100281  ORF Transcript_39150/g.100281 Transcript_39150/m.100281 type:complete len:96 (-) Transcript_39150:1643-1930(-)
MKRRKGYQDARPVKYRSKRRCEICPDKEQCTAVKRTTTACAGEVGALSLLVKWKEAEEKKRKLTHTAPPCFGKLNDDESTVGSPASAAGAVATPL